MKKVTVVFALILVLSILFTGCDLLGSSFDAAKFIKGNLDSIYLGVHSRSFIEMVVDTEADLKKAHEEGLMVEADFFMHYFDIDADFLPDSMLNEIVELLREIYKHSKYEVGEAVKSGNTYSVSVTIHPIDILQTVMEQDFEPFLEGWYEMGSRGDFDDMTVDEFEQLWARNIIDMVKARVSSIGHLDPVTVSVQVEMKKVNGQDVYTVSDEDFSNIDIYIIAY